ncbi:hypothetical protein Anapl_15929 [Anas platyrhynchos]|uniref:Uncharacterized protein n=1 Tax=Anas platyrhynchos TaxID=8839 RepID=R0L137_ANAPL|nr:hypothetical protein Anapl_15929 [Anas platyrhynchos]
MDTEGPNRSALPHIHHTSQCFCHRICPNADPIQHDGAFRKRHVAKTPGSARKENELQTDDISKGPQLLYHKGPVPSWPAAAQLLVSGDVISPSMGAPQHTAGVSEKSESHLGGNNAEAKEMKQVKTDKNHTHPENRGDSTRNENGLMRSPCSKSFGGWGRMHGVCTLLQNGHRGGHSPSLMSLQGEENKKRRCLYLSKELLTYRRGAAFSRAHLAVTSKDPAMQPSSTYTKNFNTGQCPWYNGAVRYLRTSRCCLNSNISSTITTKTSKLLGEVPEMLFDGRQLHPTQVDKPWKNASDNQTLERCICNGFFQRKRNRCGKSSGTSSCAESSSVLVSPQSCNSAVLSYVSAVIWQYWPRVSARSIEECGQKQTLALALSHAHTASRGIAGCQWEAAEPPSSEVCKPQQGKAALNFIYCWQYATLTLRLDERTSRRLSPCCSGPRSSMSKRHDHMESSLCTTPCMKNQLVQAFRLSSFLHPRGFAGHAILTPYSYEFPSSMSKPFPPHQRLRSNTAAAEVVNKQDFTIRVCRIMLTSEQAELPGIRGGTERSLKQEEVSKQLVFPQAEQRDMKNCRQQSAPARFASYIPQAQINCGNSKAKFIQIILSVPGNGQLPNPFPFHTQQKRPTGCAQGHVCKVPVVKEHLYMGAGNQSSSVELFKWPLAWFRPFSGTAQESAVSRDHPRMAAAGMQILFGRITCHTTAKDPIQHWAPSCAREHRLGSSYSEGHKIKVGKVFHKRTKRRLYVMLVKNIDNTDQYFCTKQKQQQCIPCRDCSFIIYHKQCSVSYFSHPTMLRWKFRVCPSSGHLEGHLGSLVTPQLTPKASQTSQSSFRSKKEWLLVKYYQHRD